MKVMVVLIISVLLVSILTLFWPSNNDDVSSVTNVSPHDQLTEQENIISSGDNTDTTEDRTARMTAAYETLEKKRKNLKKRLSRLKHDMWDLKFEPNEAEKINGIILNAVKLNKNPAMLGAFSGVESIQDEITKVDFADKSIDDVYVMIEENKQKSPKGINQTDSTRQ